MPSIEPGKKFMHYSGPDGDFDYDPKDYAFNEDGNLVYIGNETQGVNILVPLGITRIDYMFKDTNLETPPVIPKTVTSAIGVFENCKNLNRFAEFPSGCDTRGAYKGIIVNSLDRDPRLNSIRNFTDATIDRTVEKFDKRTNKIISHYTEKMVNMDERKAQALLLNDLKKRIAITDIYLQELEKTQEYITAKVENERKYGAPVGYMQSVLVETQNKIDDLRVQKQNIELMVRVNTPTVGDILHTAGLQAKTDLVKITQKAENSFIDKAAKLANFGKGVKGNIYRVAESSALNFVAKMNKASIEIDKICKNGLIKLKEIGLSLSVGANAIKEGFKGVVANLRGEDYTQKAEATPLGEKFADSIDKRIIMLEGSISRSEDALAQTEAALSKNIENMSPNERQDTLENITEFSKSRLLKTQERATDKFYDMEDKSYELALRSDPNPITQDPQFIQMGSMLANEISPTQVSEAEFKQKVDETLARLGSGFGIENTVDNIRTHVEEVNKVDLEHVSKFGLLANEIKPDTEFYWGSVKLPENWQTIDTLDMLDEGHNMAEVQAVMRAQGLIKKIEMPTIVQVQEQSEVEQDFEPVNRSEEVRESVQDQAQDQAQAYENAKAEMDRLSDDAKDGKMDMAKILKAAQVAAQTAPTMAMAAEKQRDFIPTQDDNK